jgi:hypothetical protein
MSRRIPPEAFDHYLGLGVGRSYQAVADHFGVSKRAVVKIAAREEWQTRVAETEEKAHQAVQGRMSENLASLNARHLRTVRLIQARAIEGLKNMPMRSAFDAIRALDLGLKFERVLLGIAGDPMKLEEESRADSLDLRSAKAQMKAGAPQWQHLCYESSKSIEDLISWKKMIDGFLEIIVTENPGITAAELRSELMGQRFRRWLARSMKGDNAPAAVDTAEEAPPPEEMPSPPGDATT